MPVEQLGSGDLTPPRGVSRSNPLLINALSEYEIRVNSLGRPKTAARRQLSSAKCSRSALFLMQNAPNEFEFPVLRIIDPRQPGASPGVLTSKSVALYGA
jgi:hypothetical protein